MSIRWGGGFEGKVLPNCDLEHYRGFYSSCSDRWREASARIRSLCAPNQRLTCVCVCAPSSVFRLEAILVFFYVLIDYFSIVASECSFSEVFVCLSLSCVIIHNFSGVLEGIVLPFSILCFPTQSCEPVCATSRIW